MCAEAAGCAVHEADDQGAAIMGRRALITQQMHGSSFGDTRWIFADPCSKQLLVVPTYRFHGVDVDVLENLSGTMLRLQICPVQHQECARDSACAQPHITHTAHTHTHY